MKLYKYRSLANFDFVLDIVLNERLHCASYEKLNDPFEGVFLSAIHMPVGLPGISLFTGGRKFTRAKSISDLPSVRKARVCSLSASLNDVRLWSNYADGHRGVAIEIDFSGIENQACKVEYVTQLKEFGGATLLGGPESKDVLKLKTHHWAYEEEYRIISGQEYFPVHERVSAVYCGLRTTELHKQLLCRVVFPHIPVFSTRLNEKKVTVEPNNQLNSDANAAGAPTAPVG